MSLADLVARRVSPLCAPPVVDHVLAVAFETGAAVKPSDLLPGGEECLALWADLAATLARRGWHAAVGWTESTPTLVMLPAGATTDDYDRCTAWWLTVEGYGDGTVNIHGCAPTPAGADLALRSFDCSATMTDSGSAAADGSVSLAALDTGPA